jgi:hypothetical protein
MAYPEESRQRSFGPTVSVGRLSCQPVISLVSFPPLKIPNPHTQRRESSQTTMQIDHGLVPKDLNDGVETEPKSLSSAGLTSRRYMASTRTAGQSKIGDPINSMSTEAPFAVSAMASANSNAKPVTTTTENEEPFQLQPPVQSPDAPVRHDYILPQGEAKVRRGVPHVYHDYSQQPDQPGYIRKKTGGVTTPFPEKLYEMLEAEAAEGPSDVVSWLPHGRAFIVRKPKEFTQSTMPK